MDKPVKKLWVDGHEEWTLNGELHREDGPARIWSDGSQEWFLNGARHRLDGPAYINPVGYQGWWVHGVHISEADFNALRNHKLLFGNGSRIY
jgi:hypothetical protein